MKHTYIQCRLTRPSQLGAGRSELVTYLPIRGSNGVDVAPGRSVMIIDDHDPRPWSIISASGPIIDQAYIRRKQREGKRLSTLLR